MKKPTRINSIETRLIEKTEKHLRSKNWLSGIFCCFNFPLSPEDKVFLSSLHDKDLSDSSKAIYSYCFKNKNSRGHIFSSLADDLAEAIDIKEEWGKYKGHQKDLFLQAAQGGTVTEADYAKDKNPLMEYFETNQTTTLVDINLKIHPIPVP